MKPDPFIPAFPSEQHECSDNTWNQTYESGMSLLDYFAAKAMQGFCANPDCGVAKDAPTIAGWSYEQAREMMRVRARQKDQQE